MLPNSSLHAYDSSSSNEPTNVGVLGSKIPTSNLSPTLTGLEEGISGTVAGVFDSFTHILLSHLG